MNKPGGSADGPADGGRAAETAIVGRALDRYSELQRRRVQSPLNHPSSDQAEGSATSPATDTASLAGSDGSWACGRTRRGTRAPTLLRRTWWANFYPVVAND
jgi:hypothetical protein